MAESKTTFTNFSLDIDGDGIALVTWNAPGRTMNVIDATATTELSAIIEELATDGAVKGVIITSGKDTFCAGADLTMLETLSRTFAELVTTQGEEAANKRLFEESRAWSLLCRRVETCGKPWVAAINGTALGGGFELTLACHHRIAADNGKTRLGLPEVKVGLFPGAGGTQRVSRMLAPADALQFLLKGDQIAVNRAKAMKLVDAVVPAGDLIKAAKDWVKTNPIAKAPWDTEGFKLPGGPVYSKAGMMVFPPANAIYRRETYDNYPAARAILQVVYEGLQLPIDQALRVELRWFAHILRSPEAAAMIRTLFVSMGELNKGARRPANKPAKTIKKIGVLGAGFMGGGIAYVSALAGLQVVLIDRDPETAEKGKAHSQKLMTDQVNRGRATAAERDTVLARIKPSADFVELKDCDLVVEAVFEDRKVKEEVISRTQNVLGAQAIFASNTSTLPITSLAAAFKDHARFIGIHFFSPVERMMLVEIIMGKETGDAALALALDYVRTIRKTPIVVNDFAWFLHLAGGWHLYPRGPSDADGRRAGGDDRECRPHGRHAGRSAFAHRRGCRRSGLENSQGDRGRSRSEDDRPGTEDAARRHGGETRPVRPQKWQGLLRLSAERLEAAMAGPCRIAVEEARPRQSRRDDTGAAASRYPGARIRPLHRGKRRHRRAGGRCRLDPWLRLRTVHRRHHLLYRRHGRQSLCRFMQRIRQHLW